MQYKIVITPTASKQLENYFMYTADVLKNPVAAKAIISDARNTKNELTNLAGSLPYCDNPKLKSQGYKKIEFLKHDFYMVFRVVEDKAVVEGMFHALQDYENALR